MSYSYNTLPRVEKEVASYNVFTVVACCAALGAAIGLISSSTTNLYTTVGSRPAVQNVIPTAYSSRPVSSRAEMIVPQAAPNSAAPEPSVQNFSLSAVAGGCIVAAAAALGALAGRVFRPAKATSSDPLGISKYQEAEERWSMMAATAFVGTKAPDFTATAVFDEEFVDVKLSQYKGKKYVVLFFYPLDFTFVCPTEITAFSDRAAEFEALDTQILGVSVDSQFSHLAWIQTPRNQGGLGELRYPLVADLKKEIAESYGVLSEDGIALRGLFIIDKEGVIQHATINNLAFGRNVEETLRVLEALQHVQANPDEVCPAGWKKGDKTMKPDPVGSKEYFSAI